MVFRRTDEAGDVAARPVRSSRDKRDTVERVKEAIERARATPPGRVSIATIQKAAATLRPQRPLSRNAIIANEAACALYEAARTHQSPRKATLRMPRALASKSKAELATRLLSVTQDRDRLLESNRAMADHVLTLERELSALRGPSVGPEFPTSLLPRSRV